MKKCVQCGGRDLIHTVERVPYSDVAIVEANVSVCRLCGERYVGFTRIEDLSREIAHHIAKKEERLSPQEVRFLRTYLGYSSKDFAEFLDVTPETVSRWESKTTPMEMQHTTELLIRFMALNETPIQEYGLDRVGTRKPSSSRPVFQRKGSGWAVGA